MVARELPDLWATARNKGRERVANATGSGQNRRPMGWESSSRSAPVSAPGHAPAPAALAVASAALFLSGGTSLVLEVAWMRRSQLLFGATTEAVSTVVAVFFAGLALGSYLFGRWSPRIARPIAAYAALETLVGAWALASLWLFDQVERAFSLIYPALAASPAALASARVCLATAVLLPPTLLMGGSLPLFCRQFIRTEERTVASSGLLYGLNTLGGACGALLAGFVLLPSIGVAGSAMLAGVVGIVASAAVFFVWHRRAPIAAPPVAAPTDDDERAATGLLVALFFVAGFVALGQEIVCTRYLALIVRNTVFTYTVSLGATLLGIVLGSLAAARFLAGATSGAAFGVVQMLAALTGQTALLLPAAFWQGFADEQRIGALVAVAGVVVLPAAALSGMSFPLAVRLAVTGRRQAGAAMGLAAAANTIGGISGSLLAGFVLLPHLGLQATLLLLSACGVAGGAAAFLVRPPTGGRAPARIGRAAAAALVGGAAWIGIPSLLGTKVPEDFLARDGAIVDLVEGKNATIAVMRRAGALVLEIDRLWQGAAQQSHQVLAGHVPMLLHPAPRRVCVVGLGAGQTVRAFLAHRTVDRLDCVEIEPGLADIVRRHFGGGWLDDRRLRMIAEDGRNWLANSREQYDVIGIEIGQTFRPGCASFYTVDFYRRAAERLAPGGIVAQFLPLRILGSAQTASAIRSFLAVFPQAGLWANRGGEFLLVGSRDTPLRLRRERLDLVAADEALRRDLDFSLWGGPAERLNQPAVFAAGFVNGPTGLARLAADAVAYRDDPPALEYAAADRQSLSSRDDAGVAVRVDDLAALTRRLLDGVEPPASIIDGAVSSFDETERMNAVRVENIKDVMVEEFLALHEKRGDLALLERARQWSEQGLRLRMRFGETYGRQGRHEEARHWFEQALLVDPDLAVAHANLGAALANLGRHTEAEEHFEAAVRLAPDHAAYREQLRTLRDAMGGAR